MPRSLTNDDAFEPSEVAEGPTLDFQRAHDCRVTATTAFFTVDANNRIERASGARSAAEYRPNVGDWGHGASLQQDVESQMGVRALLWWFCWFHVLGGVEIHRNWRRAK